MIPKQATLVREGGGNLLCCGVGGLEMETFQFALQEVVRGVSFHAHVQAEVFSLSHRVLRLDLKKNSIVFFHGQMLVLFSPFREVRCRVFVAKLPRWRDTRLQVCLHVPVAE